MLLVQLLLLRVGPTAARDCVDNFDGLLRQLEDNGIDPTKDQRVAGIKGCADARAYCDDDGQAGKLFQAFCCGTCGIVNVNYNNTTPNLLTDPVDAPSAAGNDNDKEQQQQLLPPSDTPVDLFLLGGQSECRGVAESSDLFADGDRYPELQGRIPGVWFAGYRGNTSPENFVIEPMSADVGGSTFGPEVSFGERIRNASTAPESEKTNVMVVKYCVGGTNVRSDWNPDQVSNSWNERLDDGTAAWLESSAAKFGAKNDVKTHQFVNSIYIVRRTEEALDAAGISYRWAGIVWVQGNADNIPTRDGDDAPIWKTFGENTARVWEGMRKHLNSGERMVPIIDNGANGINQLKTGKEHAISIVEGGLAHNVEPRFTASDDTGSCKLGPSNPCVGADGWYLDTGMFLHFGIDPNMLDLVDVDDGESVFHWFVDFPSDVHSAYEGMVLNGRMLANSYLREFAEPGEYDLSPYAKTEDVELLFPFDRCPDGVRPSADNICWIDYRGTPSSPVGAPVATPPPLPSTESSSGSNVGGGRFAAAAAAIAMALFLPVV